MGDIGPSFSSIFAHATSTDAVLQFLNTRDNDVDLRVEDGVWAILLGDQVLFVASSERECRDFLSGVVVGGALFPHLADWARDREAAWAALLETMLNGRIYVDTTDGFDADSVRTSPETELALSRLGAEAISGKRVGVYMADGVIAEATVIYDVNTRRWTFLLDPSTVRPEAP